MTKSPMRTPLAAICAALALCAAASICHARAAPPAGAASTTVLHTLSVPVREVSGIKLRELSGLAWDADERLLYAVSDRGTLFHFRLEVSAARIERLEPVWAARLRDPRSAGRKFNAEGLTVVNADNGIPGDTQLIVALENGPAVVRFTPLGEAVAEVTLPPALRDPERYRSKNKRLESIAAHPEHGFVMAPEAPLEGEPLARHTVYATSGSTWSFAAMQPGSDIKAIEILPGGKLLVLERLGGSANRSAVLRRFDLASCTVGPRCELSELPAPAASRVDGNFEGMTRLSDTLALLVSDDGDERDGAATFVLVSLSAPP